MLICPLSFLEWQAPLKLIWLLQKSNPGPHGHEPVLITTRPSRQPMFPKSHFSVRIFLSISILPQVCQHKNSAYKDHGHLSLKVPNVEFDFDVWFWTLMH